MDDLTLTITIQRPKPDNPDGYIGMTVASQTPGEPHPRFEDAADGKHSKSTMLRVFNDALSYFHTGHKAVANRIDPNGEERRR
jgi:hypothetical protein